jgi:hypothetical protein
LRISPATFHLRQPMASDRGVVAIVCELVARRADAPETLASLLGSSARSSGPAKGCTLVHPPLARFTCKRRAGDRCDPT